MVVPRSRADHCCRDYDLVGRYRSDGIEIFVQLAAGNRVSGGCDFVLGAYSKSVDVVRNCRRNPCRSELVRGHIFRRPAELVGCRTSNSPCAGDPLEISEQTPDQKIALMSRVGVSEGGRPRLLILQALSTQWVPRPFAFFLRREPKLLTPSGFDHVSTTKSNSTRIATHPFDGLRAGSCKERKDGGPSVGLVHAKIVEGVPPHFHDEHKTPRENSLSRWLRVRKVQRSFDFAA
jgi:hypothetical protein